MEEHFGIQGKLMRRSDNPDMVEFGYNDNTVRIQRDLPFTSGNMKKIQKMKFLNWISNKTVPKPKIKKWLKWFPKHSNNLFSMQILQFSVGEHKKGIFFKKKTNLGVNYNSGNNTENKGVFWNRCSLKRRKIPEKYI